MARLPKRLFTRADVEKKSVIWTCEAWEINWNRFPITEGMVQLPRGSAQARKVVKQQIGVTFNSRIMKWYFLTNQENTFFLFFGPRSFQFFSIFFNFEEKLRWHACAGHIPLHSENFLRATKTGSRTTSGSRSNTLATPAIKNGNPCHNLFSDVISENQGCCWG